MKTNRKNASLQSQLPAPFKPQHYVQSGQRSPSCTNPESGHKSAATSRNPVLSQDISMLSLTKTNSPLYSVQNISPQYSGPFWSNQTSHVLDIEMNNDETNQCEVALYDFEEDILIFDTTKMTQCPNNNCAENTRNSNAIHSQNNSKQSRNKPNDHNNNNDDHKEDADDDDDDDDTLDPDDEFDDQKSVSYKNTLYSYSPHQQFKAQSFIKIPRDLTQRIIPQTVRERILNVYEFINKSTAMARYCCNEIHSKRHDVIIYNFDFHDKKSNATLYCIADRIWDRKNHHQYHMREQLFTQQEIQQLQLNIVALPKSSRIGSYQTLLREIETIRNKLRFSISDVMRDTKWNRVRVFNAPLIDNKHCKKQYNKQRLTFFITKTEFDAIIQKSVCVKPVTKIQLIPIAMFDENGCEFRVEYVQIVKIRKNVDIGISYFYDVSKGTIEVTGIHLNKYCIINQHQLISVHNHCRCVDDFRSQIDDLRIGNPDDDKNRYKDVKKRKDDEIKHLKKHKDDVIMQLNVQLETLKTKLRQNVTQMQKNVQSTQQIQTNNMQARINQMNHINMPFNQYQQLMQMQMQMRPNLYYVPPIHIPPCVNNLYISSNTPQTGSTVSSGINPGVQSYINTPYATTNTPTPNRQMMSRSLSINNCVSNTFPNTEWKAAAVMRSTQMNPSDRAHTK